MNQQTDTHSKAEAGSAPLVPSITLPKGGGAIRGIGEKFGANPVTGTASMRVPIFTSPGRSGFSPELALSYDSGSGNGPFGLGWHLPVASISRKTDKGLPQYQDADESDVFLFSEAEDLVPQLVPLKPNPATENDWVADRFSAVLNGVSYTVLRYRPRIEGLFARIERWCDDDNGISFWRSISKDNVTSIYGRSEASRVFDPDDPSRVFKWLPDCVYDDKGNVIAYEYKSENRVNLPDCLHEAGRAIGSNRYLKCIRYGNTVPYHPDYQALQPTALPAADQWMFQVAFDYGDHDFDVPKVDADLEWPVREDRFSIYRAGFEIRTLRLCRRILMFHQFAELGTTPCLIRSTDFIHEPETAATLLAATRQTGYLRNPQDQSYHVTDPITQQLLSPKSMPAVEFSYTKAIVDQALYSADADTLENLPCGVDGSRYQWLDLDSEGSPGILSEEATGWYYRRNVSNLARDEDGDVVEAQQGAVRLRLDPAQRLASRPSPSLDNNSVHFADLAGEGVQCLVDFDPPLAGFHARGDDGSWESFTAFEQAPHIDWRNPNLRSIDLNGDGHADVLISEDGVFTWYPSLGKAGFGAPIRARMPADEERGPAVLFDDGEQSIHLADFSGDGLTDIVRIRNGEVCYWSNLGYGRFGAKITMDNAPLFDAPDQFDHKRVRLADIDGSGTTDLIYLGRDGVKLYFNQSGNRWSEPTVLDQFPVPDNLASVAALDMLGNGTACLAWSSPLPGDAGRQLRYLDLMGGQKPHLLTVVKNNMGAETHVRYASSTKFYLQDRLAGKPWITRLPFPVHVVEQIDILDLVGQTRFISRYQYHHGYFDGAEREFRGFGMVEQWDTEAYAALAGTPALNIDQASHVPPVLTRTWYHTGAYLQGARISLQFKDDYYREPGQNDAQRDAMLLPDTVLPIEVTLPDGAHAAWTLSAQEEREACRALKGSLLRQEIYAFDGTPRQTHPYNVSERSYTVKLLHPAGGNRHAVFFTHARETVDYHYERKLYDVGQPQWMADPRASHEMTLAVDTYGNVLRSASIGYGRRYEDSGLAPPDQLKQKSTHAVVNEYAYTKQVSNPHQYRAPLPCETRTYELLKAVPQANLQHTTNLFRFQQMLDYLQFLADGSHDIPYEDVNASGATGNTVYRRLIEHTKQIYRKNDLSGPLDIGFIESLGLPDENYKLALTPGLLEIFNSRITATDLAALLIGEGGYRDLDGNGRLWIPSGRTFYSADPVNPDSAFARSHFYLPQCAHDPFGNLSSLSYDACDLLVSQTVDAAANLVMAEHDYRALQPRKVTDANGNRTETAFDIFGMTAGSAQIGKAVEPDGKAKGDSLQDFSADLGAARIANFFSDPVAHAAALLGSATTRTIYDIDRFGTSAQPNRAATLVRNTHLADLQPGEASTIQISIAYSDGLGQAIQTKSQAAPGQIGQAGPLVPRWIGSGWIIFNNKGKPVRQYEPFFSPTHDFEFALQQGVSSTLFYDPVGRVAATLHPNHTYDKVLSDPWKQQNWDVNDTVMLDPTGDPDVGAYFSRLDPDDYLPTWHALRTDPAYAGQAAQRWPNPVLRNAETAAANKTAAHAGTPAVTYMDTLGRVFLTLADNAGQGKYATRVDLDIEGNARSQQDAFGRKVVLRDHDMLGGLLRQKSMDAGERWTANDVQGKPLRLWDDRGQTFRSNYDALRRPVDTFVQGSDPLDLSKEILLGRIVYGEGQPDDAASNLRTSVFRQYDCAGIVTHLQYDFKGNPLGESRQLLQDYTAQPDWLQNPALEAETFTSAIRYDTRNRPVQSVAPHSANAGINIVQPVYDEAGLIKQVSLWQQQPGMPLSLLDPASADQHPVLDIDYDAKGQRRSMAYGNGVTTSYIYDSQTFRLVNLRTVRASDGITLQDLYYSYDPVGNITHIQDDADIQNVVYFKNQRVEPSADYVYDAIYRLTQATGREHLGQTGGQLNSPQQVAHSDAARMGLPQPGDGNAMGRYTEDYFYDDVGNLLQLAHAVGNNGWSRYYAHDEPSLTEPGKKSNRLSGTSLPGDSAAGPYSATYDHDAHGNMTRMPHLAQMAWNSRDQLSMVDLGGGGHAYYVYDAGGQRVRKVWEKSASTTEERIYLGGFEIFRKRSNGTIALERETLHLSDGTHRIALADTKTVDADAPANALPETLMRYQFGNHLGSASLELDDAGAVITYEEYHPFGSTAYQAGRSAAETALKRYRYTGRERDDETGLNYHSARYYAPWLGRWTAADPSGLADGSNLYRYSRNNPVILQDPSGHVSIESLKKKVSKAIQIAGALLNLQGAVTDTTDPSLTDSKAESKTNDDTSKEANEPKGKKDEPKVGPPPKKKTPGKEPPPKKKELPKPKPKPKVDPKEEEARKEKEFKEAQEKVYEAMRKQKELADKVQALQEAAAQAEAARRAKFFGPPQQGDFAKVKGNPVQVMRMQVATAIPVTIGVSAVGTALEVPLMYSSIATVPAALVVAAPVAAETAIGAAEAGELVSIGYRLAPVLRFAPVVAGGAAPLMPRVAPYISAGGDALQKYGPVMGHALAEQAQALEEAAAEGVKHLRR